MDTGREFTFGMMPAARSRWQSFATSFLLQAAMIALVVAATLSMPKIVLRQPDFQHVELIAPETAPPRVEARVRPRVVMPSPEQLREVAPVQARMMPAPLLRPRAEAPKLVAPVVKDTMAPKFDSLAMNEPAMPKLARQVKTNVFGGSSARPTLKHELVSRVQTGGFGDPNGVPANRHGSNHPNIAMLGSFDLPQGGGYGNGSGGTHGARGAVASAGFGNGIASPVAGEGRGRPGRVQMAAFGSQEEAAQGPVRRIAVERPTTKPVTIESKPKPVYTEEARARGIEGAVLVRVTFTADGRVLVDHVIRGLGFGLDEAAIRAAQGIRFEPAERDGHAVDSTATLRVVFQLS